MAYHTASYYCVFLPLALIVYQLFPQKARWVVLLSASYLFYWSISKNLLIFLIGSSLFTHYICVCISWYRLRGTGNEQKQKTAGIIGRSDNQPERKILIFGILTLLGILGWMKYYNFFVENWNSLSKGTGVLPVLKTRELLLPLGISFYTLQAIGYMIDVYWKKADVYPNPGKTALFLGFFPQIMEGPIASYNQTAEALWAGAPLRKANLSAGCIRILWGLFKKLIIADRLYRLVGTVFDHYEDYHGSMIAVAAIAYTLQLYMEFSGCMDIVVGSGRLFGIVLPENFRQPFFAVDAADFWRRWHISLGVWFRTYIFYPVSVSGTVKKWNRYAKAHFKKSLVKTGVLALSLFPVWLCNGLWHGPRWSYIFYGMYYYVILVFLSAFDPMRTEVLKRLHISRDAGWYKGIRILKTWMIIFIGELFFRAESLTAGIHMFRSMFHDFSFRQIFGGALLKTGLDKADYLAIFAGLAAVIIVDIVKEKNLLGDTGIQRLNLPLRWSIYYALVFSVVIFGAYGTGYQAVDLIYAGF